MSGGAGEAAGRLTTHVLDTARGCPAADLSLSLYRFGDDGAAEHLGSWRTNGGGRCDGPLLSGGALKTGYYRLLFEVGAYFRDAGFDDPEPAFLESVPIDFGIADSGEHYHVPLLISPYGYSTYRGS